MGKVVGPCAQFVAPVVTTFLEVRTAHVRATLTVPMNNSTCQENPERQCVPVSRNLTFSVKFDVRYNCTSCSCTNHSVLAFGLRWQPAEILGMSPDAPEAEIFKEYAKTHEGKNGTTIPAAAAGTYCLPSTIFSLQSSFPS